MIFGTIMVVDSHDYNQFIEYQPNEEKVEDLLCRGWLMENRTPPTSAKRIGRFFMTHRKIFLRKLPESLADVGVEVSIKRVKEFTEIA